MIIKVSLMEIPNNGTVKRFKNHERNFRNTKNVVINEKRALLLMKHTISSVDILATD